MTPNPTPAAASDDELAKMMARAISGSGVTSPTSLRKARAALTICRPIIEREALEKAADKLIDLQNESSDISWNNALDFAINAISALIPREGEKQS